MVDAGSMGSRIHTYKFNYCSATPELENETFDHVEPGLSSYGEDAEGAAKSLDMLLDGALNTVPRPLHTSTPIAVKATAGLRLLGEEKSNRILAAVRQRIESRYPFPIIEEQGVAVMDGADEGMQLTPISGQTCKTDAIVTHLSFCHPNPRCFCLGHCQLSLGPIQFLGEKGNGRYPGSWRCLNTGRV